MQDRILERKVRRAEEVCLTVIQLERLISRRLADVEEEIRQLKEKTEKKDSTRN